MDIIPAPSVLAAYSVACFVLFVTPGPDMSLFLARTMAGGRAAGRAREIRAVLTAGGGPNRVAEARRACKSQVAEPKGMPDA